MKGVVMAGIQVRKPSWLKRKLPKGAEYEQMKKLIKNNCLSTVCQEAQCPNQFECFSRGTATFMILGERCTRNCRFCAVSHQPLTRPDPGEPQRVAAAVAGLKLKYAVITSVTRDDLEDGGASHFVETLHAVHEKSPGTRIELLIPDLQGNKAALESILDANPDVLNHNLETVSSLYAKVRPQAVYERSLELIRRVKSYRSDIPTKSGIMLGLGESRKELLKAMSDLVEHGCDILTLGQYLQPSAEHLAVERFVPPDEFAELKALGEQLGFKGVISGPMVRSSYEAGEVYLDVEEKLRS